MKAITLLAIESAIAGGSVAFIEDGTVLAKWSGGKQASRSEELLPRIAEVLAESGTTPRDLRRVVVSNGPGSYTGIRIGIATAMGLATALNIPCTGVSLLAAVAETVDAYRDRLIVVPLGRSGHCWQFYPRHDSSGTCGPVTSGTIQDLNRSISEYPQSDVLAYPDTLEELRLLHRGEPADVTLIDMGRDLAVAVGRAATRRDDGLEPLYTREHPVSRSKGRTD